MAKYRKKPVVVEARLLDDSTTPGEIAAWCGGRVVKHGSFQAMTIAIDTLEGEMTAQKNDYIIKGVQGEFYPCKPEIFEKTYEKVEE